MLIRCITMICKEKARGGIEVEIETDWTTTLHMHLDRNNDRCWGGVIPCPSHA
jgi:hypothetical protein